MTIFNTNPYENIETPLQFKAMIHVVDWRNENGTFLRKVGCGTALSLCTLTGVIEITSSVALGILTSPLELLSLQYSRHFFKRAQIGCETTLYSLVFQYLNIINEEIGVI